MLTRMKDRTLRLYNPIVLGMSLNCQKGFHLKKFIASLMALMFLLPAVAMADSAATPYSTTMRDLWGSPGDSNYAVCTVEKANGVNRYYYLAGLSYYENGDWKDQICFRDEGSTSEVMVLNASNPSLLAAVQADGSDRIIHVGDPTVLRMINGGDGSELWHMYFTVSVGHDQIDNQCWGASSADGITWGNFKRTIGRDLLSPGWGDGAACPSVIEYPGLPDGAMFAMVFDNRQINDGIWLVTTNGLMDVVHGPVKIYTRSTQSPASIGVTGNPVIRKFGNTYSLFFNEWDNTGLAWAPQPLPPELVGNPMTLSPSAPINIAMCKSTDITNFDNGSRTVLVQVDGTITGAASVPGVTKVDDTHYKLQFTQVYGVYSTGWYDLSASWFLKEWDMNVN